MEFALASNEQDDMQMNEPHPPLFDPKPLVETGRRWRRWLGPLISFAVLVAIIFKLGDLLHRDLGDIRAMIPVTSLFWSVFFATYFVGPLTDWMIFRKLWTIPVSGFFALLRKQVTNALLPSYSGEVYFYAWARRRTELTGAPFGAIKDVAIISALTGNFVTLVMLVAAYPLFGSLIGGVHVKTFAISIGFITFSSLIVMFFRSRLFSLPRGELTYVTGVVLARIIIGTALTALMWYMIMPSVELGWWLLLATIKLLLTRLPFVPNQDLLFATVAIALIGHDQPLTQLVTLVAIATTLANIVFGIILGLTDLLFAGDHADA